MTALFAYGAPELRLLIFLIVALVIAGLLTAGILSLIRRVARRSR